MKSKNLIPFILIVICVSTFLNASNAQVIYTNVNPDLYVNSNGTYNLDLNNDGIIDYMIVANKIGMPAARGSVFIETISGNESVGETTYPSPLNYGDSITSRRTFITAKYQFLRAETRTCLKILCHYLFQGNWDNTDEHYLGLKFIKDAKEYYGWACLSVSVSQGQTNPLPVGSFTLKGYAYNSIPTQPILAGDTGSGFTGMISIQNDALSVVSFDKKIIINSSNKISLFAIINVYNIMGQEVKRTKSSNSKTEIDMSECRSGFYIVTVQTNNAIETRKIYLN